MGGWILSLAFFWAHCAYANPTEWVLSLSSVGAGEAATPLKMRIQPMGFVLSETSVAGLEIRYSSGDGQLVFVDNGDRTFRRLGQEEFKKALQPLVDPVARGKLQAALLVDDRRREVERELDLNAASIRSAEAASLQESDGRRMKLSTPFQTRQWLWMREKKTVAESWVASLHEPGRPQPDLSAAKDLAPLLGGLWKAVVGREAAGELGAVVDPRYSRLLVDLTALLRDPETLPIETYRYNDGRTLETLTLKNLSSQTATEVLPLAPPSGYTEAKGTSP